MNDVEGNDGRDVKAPVTCIADPTLNTPCYRITAVSHYLGWTPLLRACRYGQTDVVARLLSSGADPTALDELGWNAAPLAVASGNIATVKEILQAVKWNRKDLAPALCLAALDGYCEVAEVLLTSRANANEPIPDSGITPLMLAAGEGHTEMVTLLLEHGADPDMTNALHQTALDASVVRNHCSVQNILGPVTQLRSKISSHIPLPVSPPNRALNSPTSFQADNPFLVTSPFMGSFQNHSAMGSSPMLHCMQIPSPICPSYCVPSGTLVANSAKRFISPFPASYYSLASPFNFQRIAAQAGPFPGSCQNVCGSFQNISCEPELNSKSVTKANKRLRKWWCQMKKRCKRDRSDFVDEDSKSQDVAMEKRFANFLRSIKMMEYHPLFKSQEVDFETFLTLKEEDLEEIGVQNPAHRFKIVEKIEKFSQNASNL